MPSQKLIETRGEEPAFLPGHVDETWRRVDFGLGASSVHANPEVLDALPPRSFPWKRVMGYALAAGLGMVGLLGVIRIIFG